MTPIRWAASSALALCTVALTASPAAAHAELKTSDPADGSTLAAVPARLTLTFTEGASATQSTVTFGSRRLTITQPAGHPDMLVADLGPLGTSLRGPVSIGWRSVSSDDGHVPAGTLHFHINVPASTSASAGPAADSAGVGDSPLLYGSGLGILCLAFGGVLFVTVRRARR